jgi:hypothetical protein
LRDVLVETENALTLEIEDCGRYRALYTGLWQGALRPDCHWETAAVPAR